MNSFASLNMYFIPVLILLNASSLKAGNNEKKINLPGDTVTWKFLGNVEFKEMPHDTYGTAFIPSFSKEIKKIASSKVIIKGYLVPVDKTIWALSKNPNASCFFCGKAGPETVVGLSFKGNQGKLKMDAEATITGKFILNGTNVDDWMYSLTDAEILSIK